MLSYQLYEHTKGSPLVLFSHGLGEYGTLYEPLAKQLNAAGYSVILYDVIGHGVLEPKGTLKDYQDLIKDIDEILNQNRRDRKVFLMGHSMGAMISNLYAVTNREIDGVISIGYQYHPIKAVKWMGLLFPKKRLYLNWSDPRSRHEKTNADIEDPNLLKSVSFKFLYETIHKANKVVRQGLKQYPCPILVIHGGADKIVPLHNAHALYDHLPKPKEMIVYPDSYHDVLLDIDQALVVEDIINWLNQYK